MGRWVSAAYGYGIVLPDENEDEFDHTKMAEYLQEYVTTEEEGSQYTRTYVDWYFVTAALTKKYALKSGHGGTEDYSISVIYAVSVKSTYDALTSFDRPLDEPTDEQVSALRAAAVDLGIDFEPGWLLVASYG